VREVAHVAVDDAEQCDDGGLVSGNRIEIAHKPKTADRGLPPGFGPRQGRSVLKNIWLAQSTKNLIKNFARDVTTRIDVANHKSPVLKDHVGQVIERGIGQCCRIV
jgi:hypothetical protein